MNNSVKSTLKPKKSIKNSLWKYILPAIFIIVVFHNFFGAMAYNTFVVIDNSLKSFGASSPIFMWVFIGVCAGLLLGSIIACIKYQLDKKISLLIGLPIGGVIVFMFINAIPLNPIPFRVEVANKEDKQTEIDSLASMNEPLIVDRVNKVPIKKKVEPKIKQGTCATKTALVKVTVRSDSLILYYRIADTEDGEWSDWNKRMIPQPGKYALSGQKGDVFANSIQYYYQVGNTYTRSATDPFIKTLCNGDLVLDTY